MFQRVVVIGLGGIGSHLVEPLARYLANGFYCKNLLLVDGDGYSRENGDRQSITGRDVNKNKAEAQAQRIQALFPALAVSFKSEYVSRENVAEVMQEENVVFSCVDNHATRKILCDQAKRLKDVLLLSAGNDYTDGNVQVHFKEKGRNKTHPIDHQHMEIKYPADRNPAELSCEELADLPSGGQIIFTNLTAACLALNAFYDAIRASGASKYDEVYFDIEKNVARPAKR